MSVVVRVRVYLLVRRSDSGRRLVCELADAHTNENHVKFNQIEFQTNY